MLLKDGRTHGSSISDRIALVYRGKASCKECPEALARLLSESRWGFDVKYVGEKENLQLSPAVLASAVLYAQPGGGNSVQRAYRHMKQHERSIKSYVARGGRYLGICMGGYLAGHWRGFSLLPEDCDQYIKCKGASITTKKDTLVEVDWRGQRHRLFFQDGPVFRLPLDHPRAEVLATYSSNGEVAAMVSSYGRGHVGVCGPHPEAPSDWFKAHGLTVPRGSSTRLGHDLIDVLMSFPDTLDG